MLLVVVALLGATALGMVAAMQANLKSEGVIDRSIGGGSEEALQTAKLNDAAEKIRLWYEQNAWDIDADSSKPDVPALLSDLGIDLGTIYASADATPRLMKDGIAYHVFALWYNLPDAVGTGLNQVTGEFQPGTINGSPATTPFVVVSGFPVQARKYNETRARMAKVADRMITYFAHQAHGDVDPDAASDTNWFKDPDCSLTAVAFPCWEVNMGIVVTDLPYRLGLNPPDYYSGWHPGSWMVVNNADASGPPYKVRLQTATPWDTIIEVYAISN